MTLKQTANIAIYGVFVAEPAHGPFLLPTLGVLNIHAPLSLLLSAATASCAELRRLHRLRATRRADFPRQI
jgi:hypothetical protein